ncbi:MAG: helix-turn-helix transcriptional regulator [Treponema sp.]|nr:helix-turn-helix transcriptional regulator [Treponema sp.]
MKDVLKYLRQTGGFTQAQVASMLGVSRQSYNKYEKGVVVPSDQLVAKVAKVYGVDEAFIRANKIPLVGHSGVEYKIEDDADLPLVASPEKSYDAYFDGTAVRVIGGAKFYQGQRFKLLPVDDEESGDADWNAFQDILSKHDPLVMPSDKDPYYKEMLKEAVEKKYGYTD